MNEMLATFFWKQLWQVTLLIPVAVLCVRYVLPKKPHLAYGILLLVLVKTIFPPIWDSPTGVVWEMVPYFSDSARSDSGSISKTSAPAIATKISRVKPTVELDVPVPPQAVNAAPVSPDHFETKSKQATAVPTSPWHWGPIIFGVWLAGALCLFGYIIGKRAQLLRFHRDMQVTASDRLLELIEEVSAELGLLRIPKVLVTLHPTVPFATGFFRQLVVLPEHVVKQTDSDELKLILAHEMTHLRRGDTFVGLLQLLVQVVWWFHPLVHWLNTEVRRLREECCDTDVVAQLNCQPASYARCLLNMLEMHQKLRPSTELVGLSPFEVTAKRMQNIMRTKERKSPNRLGNIARSLVMLCFALAILPATASSSVTPKVIVGELKPPSAVREAPPRRSPKKVPRRKKKSPSKKRNESQVASKPESKESSPQPTVPDDFKPLSYKWVRGDRHTYSVTIEAKYPLQIRTDKGQPTFRVDAYAAGLPALSMKNAKFSKQSIPREGIQLPTLPDSGDADAEDPSYPFTPRRPFGSPYSSRSETNSSAPISGSNGHVNPSSGQLPYLLGSLKDWVFPTLPQDGKNAWQEESIRDFNLTPEHFASLNPFSTSPKERMRANINIKSTVQSVTKNRVTILRSWTLRTEQEANGEPRREISLSGEIQFDSKSSFPISASYTGRLVERERNREYRIPLKIEILRKND